MSGLGRTTGAGPAGRPIHFYAPGLKRWQSAEWQPTNPRRFLPVSVTGGSCALQCDHCQAKVLEGMVSVRAGRDLYEVARALHQRGTQGILLSGGSGRNGAVPLERHLRLVPRIRAELGMRVVVHCGVATPGLARALADAGVDGVMVDLIGARETLQDVYHLDLGPEDVDRALGLLCDAGLRVIPHIVLGLHYGRFLGEQRALAMAVERAVGTLILVVLVPLVGTPMADCAPPEPTEVTAFFETARDALPTATVNLGCARPMGRLKRTLDEAAVDLGLDGIAYPAEGMVAYARSRGRSVELHEWCCSMTWEEEPLPLPADAVPLGLPVRRPVAEVGAR
ncbi:radical SAM protein [Aciditerrimonas ferrireducens]|uniref:Radical SAM protein n=1 Tax=Aciditerrimonas ferrireducens TaxID=667306 RepID=A0ABV6BZ90_9ACTN